MAHRYLIKLMQQYNRATGNKETVLYDPLFLDWLKQYKESLLLLKQYYKELGVNLDSTKIYETDKGLSDRIVNDINQQITQYYDPYEYIDYNKDGKLVRTNDMDRKNKKREEEVLNGSDLIFTFNPYHWDNIAYYPAIIEKGVPISISMVGMKKDQDRELKIAYIEAIKKYLPNCEYFEKEDKDRFYKCIKSKSYIDHSKVQAQPVKTELYGASKFRPKK